MTVQFMKLIASGNTLGVFQLESLGMTQFMKNLAPDCFEDIIAGISPTVRVRWIRFRIISPTRKTEGLLIP